MKKGGRLRGPEGSYFQNNPVSDHCKDNERKEKSVRVEAPVLIRLTNSERSVEHLQPREWLGLFCGEETQRQEKAWAR